jgi:hypothetical protein
VRIGRTDGASSCLAFDPTVATASDPDEQAPKSSRGRHVNVTRDRRDENTLFLNITGIEFIDENCGGPGVRLRKRERKKTYATRSIRPGRALGPHAGRLEVVPKPSRYRLLDRERC